MSTQQTPHHQLCQWLPEDAVLRTDFNEDNIKLDTALHQLQTGKADQTALTALQATVAGKAEQTALAALQTAVSAKADQTALSALQTTVNSKANSATVSALSTRVGNVEVKQAADVTALRGENCWIALKRARLTADSKIFTIPLTGVPMASLRELRVSLRLSHSTNQSFFLRYNSVDTKTYEYHGFSVYAESGNYWTGLILGQGAGTLSGDLTILPMMDTGTAHHYMGTAAEGNATFHLSCGRNSSIPFRTLTSLSLHTEYLFHAGSEVAVYGLKDIP